MGRFYIDGRVKEKRRFEPRKQGENPGFKVVVMDEDGFHPFYVDEGLFGKLAERDEVVVQGRCDTGLGMDGKMKTMLRPDRWISGDELKQLREKQKTAKPDAAGNGSLQPAAAGRI